MHAVDPRPSSGSGGLLGIAGVGEGGCAIQGNHAGQHREDEVCRALTLEELARQRGAPDAGRQGRAHGGGEHGANDRDAEAGADLLGGVVQRGPNGGSVGGMALTSAIAQIVMITRRPSVIPTMAAAIAR
jgi:hypothetical protein